MTDLLVLPYPPSVNRMYRVFRGRSIISREGREYRDQVVAILRAQDAPLVACRCAVEIAIYPPDRRRRDLDNVCKALLDGLVHGGALADDGLIDELRLRRMGRKPGGEVWVQITELVTELEYPEREDER